MNNDTSGLIELIIGVGGSVLAVLAYFWNIYKTQLALYDECIKIKAGVSECLDGRPMKTDVVSLRSLICLDCGEIKELISDARFNLGIAIVFALGLFTLGVLFGDYIVAAFYAVLSLGLMLTVLWRSTWSLVGIRENLSAAHAELEKCATHRTR
ncbi:MAG: hypothetical protein GSR84_04610 [Desulfurococcales archaeon]|nr:hypothetical protein [Desulfurococcales archaeon]